MVLAVVGSPWQVIVLVVYYRTYLKDKEVFIIFEKASEKSLSASRSLLVDGLSFNVIFNWDKVKGFKKAFTAKKYILSLFSKLDFSKVNKLIVGSENNELVRYINLKVPDTAFRVKIDDGVLDYLPQIGNIRSARYTIRLIIGYGFYTLKRFLPDKLFMVYPDFYASIYKLNANVEKIDLSIFKNELKDMLKSDTLNLFGLNESVYLLIGQALSEDKVLTLEEEISLYSECIKRIPESEGLNIYFKPHPRSSLEKISKIEELISINKLKFLNTNLSLEEIYVNYKIEKVFGLYSNGVIYSNKLFEVPSESMIPILLKKQGLSNHSKLVYIHEQLENLGFK